ncbi:unnamed protein product [Rhizoctonia solani]|uniref:O-methylsterigmatocystin oxidoreductase n=1 Tax=Rhizoctonia solani TaxID=456999 RepID=A0A8H2WK35_9AGAM|nr:unnamed protein product [Rhizoctonia solani]
MAWDIPLTILAVVLITYVIHTRSPRARKLPLPPGPRADPLIGHLRALPTSDEHLVYTRWGKELNSDVVSISVLGQAIVVLNSAKAANELLEQRSSTYSSRAQLPMISVDWSKLTGLLPYGERWRAQRRLTHLSLHKKASRELCPLVVKQVRLALARIVDNPDGFVREIRRMTGSTLLSAVYGYEVTSAHDPLVEVVEKALDHLCYAGIPGNMSRSYTPSITHVMFNLFRFPCKRYALDTVHSRLGTWDGVEEDRETVEKRAGRDGGCSIQLYQTTNCTLFTTSCSWSDELRMLQAQGTTSHSILKTFLVGLEGKPSSAREYEEQEDQIKWVTGTLFGAGSDTSAATALVFILAMVLNQSVFSKAQAEVDDIVGHERLPEMSDRKSLVYVECVMKEVFRWQPVLPLALPHAVIEDDEYRGWRIPKGTTVMGNIWAINYDESVYPEPERFNPDRFLDSRVPTAPGFRLCPGVHMAESTMFIMFATLLALFDIRPAKDEDGKEIIPKIRMKTNALISYPEDFKCSITPRSEKAIGLLNASVLGV